MKDMKDVLSSFYEGNALKRGLPAASYVSQDYYEAECQTVFPVSYTHLTLPTKA